MRLLYFGGFDGGEEGEDIPGPTGTGFAVAMEPTAGIACVVGEVGRIGIHGFVGEEMHSPRFEKDC